MQKQVAIICQRERRHFETTRRADFERPSRQNPFQLVVDPGMLDQETSRIGFQDSFEHGALHGSSVVVFGRNLVDQRALSFRDPEKSKQLR